MRRRPTRSAVLLLVVAGATPAAAAPPVAAPDPPPVLIPAGATTFVGTSGPTVARLARDGDRIYASGDFEAVGTYVGPLARLDGVTGAPLASPTLDGQVSDAVADPAGGTYLAGDFVDATTGRHEGLMRLRPDGRVDEDFDASVRGMAYALALDGPRLYVGGRFEGVNGPRGADLAAVDARTGASLPGFQPAATRTPVTELAVAPAPDGGPGRLYVGSDRVEALDGLTGTPVPGFAPPPTGLVRALALTATDLYVGGEGVLVALDPGTGRARPDFGVGAVRRPPGRRGATVHVLLPAAGHLWVGLAPPVQGQDDVRLLAVDLATGAPDPSFAPLLTQPNRFGAVYDLAQVGGRLWVGGDFAAAADPARRNLVALDPNSGALLEPRGPRLDGEVDALVEAGGRLVAGGKSLIPDRVPRDGLAALGPDGRLDRRFAPATRPLRRDEDLLAGAGRLVIGPTVFPTPNPPEHRDPRRRRTRYPTEIGEVAILDGSTGRQVRSVRLPRLAGVAILGDELVVAQRRNDRDRFVGVQLRRFALADGRRLGRSTLALKGYVRRLVTVGGRLYAAGSFKRRRSNGQAANIALIRVDAATGAVDARFDPHVDAAVADVSGGGGQLYVAGDFDRAGPVRREAVVAVDAASGLIRPGFDVSKAAEVLSGLAPLPLRSGLLLASLDARSSRTGFGDLPTLLRPDSDLARTPRSLIPSPDVVLPGAGQEPDLAARSPSRSGFDPYVSTLAPLP